MSVLSARCPWCGLLIIRNDSEKKISHENPVCERFTELLAGAGVHTSTLELINPRTGRRIVPTGQA